MSKINIQAEDILETQKDKRSNIFPDYLNKLQSNQ